MSCARLMLVGPARACRIVAPRITSRTYFDDDDDDLHLQDGDVVALNYKLKRKLIMKQYFEAVKIWEEHRKNVYIPNISTYEVILRLCQSISSSPALEEVRKDMASVGVVMDVACGLTYVWTLLSLDMAEEALNFIQQELTLKGDGTFISKCAALYLHTGHTSHGMHVCKEYVSTGISPNDDIHVKCIHCRLLANMGQCSKAIDMLSTDNGGTVIENLTLADILASSGRFDNSLAILEKMPTSDSGHHQLEYISSIVQHIRDSGDLSLVPRTHAIVQKYFEGHEAFDFRDISIFADINKTYLTQLLTNMMYFQGRLSNRTDEVYQAVLSYNYFKEFRANSLNPNVDTYTAVMLLLVHDRISASKASLFVKKMRKSEIKLCNYELVQFLKYCDTLSPSLADKMLLIVGSYPCLKSPLTLQQFKVLLSMRYHIGDSENNRHLAIKCVRRINNIMRERNMLTTSEAANSVLKAYAEIGDFGAIFTFYKDLDEISISPNIATYHILLDATIKNPDQRACHKIATMVIRALQGQDLLKPHIELVEKMVKCCKLSGEYTQLQVIANLLDGHGKLTSSLQEELKEISSEDVIKNSSCA